MSQRDKLKAAAFFATAAIAVVTMTILVSCAALGVRVPQTIPERATAAEVGVKAAADTVTANVTAGTLKSDDAKAIVEVLRQAHDVLGIAEEAFAAGDVSTAEQRLAFAEALLKGVRARLGETP